MFYHESVDARLRFGDVLKGFTFATPLIENPFSEIIRNYKIDVCHPSFCVVISPCCSIEDEIVSLCPLVKLFPGFFGNPHFAEDLTRINRIMDPENAVSPKAWMQMSDDEKGKRLAEGKKYALLNFFMYEHNDIFEEYTVSMPKVVDLKTKYYMIDFKSIYKISCNALKSGNKLKIVESKCLQLSKKTRDELRKKLSHYFGRTPLEDEDLLG